MSDHELIPVERIQIKRNTRKFPEDFMFRLTRDEGESVLRSRSHQVTASRNRSQNATGFQTHRDPRFLPYAFTEHGAIQAANVLNSNTAVEMSVHVVRAFVRLRQWLGSQKILSAKLSELERRVGSHDKQIAALIEAIRLLTATPTKSHGRRIGFHPT